MCVCRSYAPYFLISFFYLTFSIHMRLACHMRLFLLLTTVNSTKHSYTHNSHILSHCVCVGYYAHDLHYSKTYPFSPKRDQRWNWMGISFLCAYTHLYARTNTNSWMCPIVKFVDEPLDVVCVCVCVLKFMGCLIVCMRGCEQRRSFLSCIPLHGIRFWHTHKHKHTRDTQIHHWVQ